LYLPPTGKIVLAGPEVWRVDESLNGLYQVLLRVEASDDREADTDLASVGAGAGVVHGGAVAGFPLPVLKYYVANASSPQPVITGNAEVFLLQPADQALLSSNIPVDFSWSPMEDAVVYRFEVEDLLGTPVISAILPKSVGSYRTPSWFKDKVVDTIVRWRVIAFDQQKNSIATTEWRALRFKKASQ
jgi:hypothetical protein